MSAARAVDIDSTADALHADAIVWDQHGSLTAGIPPKIDEDAVEGLEVYREGGVDVVCVGIGSDLTSTVDTFKVVAAYRRGLQARPDRFLLVSGPADVDEAKRTGRLAVTFHLEGTEPLDGEIGLLGAFHELGVRSTLMTYNQRNRAGGGCHDDPEVGLTDFGRALVTEMNDLGIVVDASHCSPRTALDLFELSSKPVVFSHSVPAGVHAHDRNVTDEQMRACAATGGVVGVNGVGILLGEDASTDALVRAVDYAVGVVGPDHVGLGLDYQVDQSWIAAYMQEHPELFPADGGYADNPLSYVSPAQLPEVTARLLQLAYTEDAVRGIMGGNFQRVAQEVWSSQSS